MRPVSIRFRCFGPYMEEQFIDFEELERKGLFLICGETGAGKTAILDAMCYALYGKSSGGLRGELAVMRCKLAGKDDETRVEFIFDAGGKRYQFVRSLRFGKKKLNDFHNCLVLEDGVYVPVFENPKIRNVNQKAEEILGLTYEQFCQVIILPQGQFERLLVSDSAEKEKILVSLFRAEKWQRIADEIYNRVVAKDKKLREEIADIKSRLSDYRCDTVEQLNERLSEEEEKAKLLYTGKKEAEQKEKIYQTEYDRAVQMSEKFQELLVRREREKKLRSRSAAMDEEENVLKNSDQADALKPCYDLLQEWKEKESKCKIEYQTVGKKYEKAEKRLKDVYQEKERHEQQAKESEIWVRDMAALEAVRELYQKLDVRKQEVQKAQADEENRAKEYKRADTVYAAAHGKWVEALKKQQEILEVYQKIQAAYLSGIRGILAETLQEGSPCPVCGSLEHPAPASADGEKVTEAEVNKWNESVNASARTVVTADKEQKKAEEVRKEAQTAYQDAVSRRVALATAYEEMLRQKIEGIDTAEQLDKKRRTLQKKIEKYRADSARISADLMEAEGDKKAALAVLEQAKQSAQDAKKKLDEAGKDWKQKLDESIFPAEDAFLRNLLTSEERDKKKEMLIRFSQELAHAVQAVKEQEEKLAGEERPDISGAVRELEDAKKQHEEVKRRWILAQQELERMGNVYAALAKRKSAYEEQRVKVDADLEFANRLRGRSGSSLQRYVLGVMLSSITAEANRLLKGVHGGRYQLYRTDEIAGSGHKGGLELEVLDLQSNERRSVTTLSGGEKFLAALSLAIGLSAVVQAQGSGIRLGAMFIDEGFGSLDQNSIYDSLEVLQGIQKANGLVGIISHVEMLENTIMSKIEVSKGKNGSTLKIVTA